MSRSNRSLSGMDLITLETIMTVQNDIDPADMISLMFLLYEDSQTALKNLLMYQHLSADIGVGECGLLHEWAAQAHTRKTWKWELLEALATCQLYSVTNTLGFHKQMVMKLFKKDNEISNYINPTKKIFYYVCENMDSTSYRSFKQIINSDFVKIPDHKTCEFFFLELMCQGFFIPISEFGDNINKLLHIISNIPTCKTLYCELKAMSDSNKSLIINIETPQSEIPTTSKASLREHNHNDIYNVQDFENEFQLINELENLNLVDLKTDDKNLDDDHGVCLIINQEKFNSCNSSRARLHLSNRPESAADKICLERTMNNHHIKAISCDNLSRAEMFDSIKNVVKKCIKKHHRVFFLCILSHGCRDHVYSADCERVKLVEIEDLLDSDDAIQLRAIPKVLIVQACQADEVILEADSSKHYINKTDMITFCSTAPGYKAYRVKGFGSLFIFRLCNIIQTHSNEEHLSDLFLKVKKDVYDKCSAMAIDQLPIILRDTLKTKIYLKKRNVGQITQ